MADTLVERVTGQTTATAVPVEIELIMTDQTLFGGHETSEPDETSDPVDSPTDGPNEPAELIGFGPISAELAREIALEALGEKWLRRLYTNPLTGQLAAMDATRRNFTTNQRRFVRLRDQGRCRIPWCEAAIRHTDHLIPHGQGGKTRTDNGAGTCEACNYAKQAAGWTTRPSLDGSITVTTPTGHRYASRQPVPPGNHHRRLEIDVSLVDLIYLHGRRAA
ncbi:HNH endonuclease [uncultured Jatrophihabitans sp.]|uniref:HNH endonuclease n=1 Tax=uncultured Jatrophihabitans sp. TaxID=1610747 RepID=UPI0035CC2299